MGNKRIVIKNGGIKEIITTDAKEQANLDTLKNIDYKMMGLRNMIRSGDKIDLDIKTYFNDWYFLKQNTIDNTI